MPLTIRSALRAGPDKAGALDALKLHDDLSSHGRGVEDDRCDAKVVENVGDVLGEGLKRRLPRDDGAPAVAAQIRDDHPAAWPTCWTWGVHIERSKG
jgi:hypothetical protein